MKRCWTLVALALGLTACPGSGSRAVVIGAVYPVQGAQGTGGLDEFRGAQLAVELANARGGVRGTPMELRLSPANSADQAAGAIQELARAGIPVVLGSHGSTISAPAADAAQRRGIVFWETGAVGQLGMRAAAGDKVFRFSPTGALLGRAAASFAREELLPRMGRDPRKLRYGVAYIDDAYGRAVGLGAVEEVARAGLTLAGAFPYALTPAEYARVVRAVADARVDVLFVSAYLDDGVALRKQMVAQDVPLVASVGTSSSYCMHAFGEALGTDAVGLFASDKPDGDVLDPSRLAPKAAEALRWARARFNERYEHEMTANALTGFAGAWALVHEVLPRALGFSADAIARAARTTVVPKGSLPNGSGLEFAASGTENLRATSVIWEWVKPKTRAVVWPPEFATSEIVPLPIS